MNGKRSIRPVDLIVNGDFSAGRPGRLPEGWRLRSPRPSLAPIFRLVRRKGRRVLLAGGNGRDDCVGCVQAPVTLRAGRTYRLRARLEISRDFNPQKHLLVCVFAEGFNNGIFRFRRLRGRMAEGEGNFLVPGHGVKRGTVRVYFRRHARARAWIHAVGLQERGPIPPRPARLACVQGNPGLAGWRRVMASAAKARADLLLLPEMINGLRRESLSGPSARLMAAGARRFGMYVAGGVILRDVAAGRVHNAVLLFDRRGRLLGKYFKNHLFTPEELDSGLSCGADVPVFRTDFGTVGVMTCYDSWFTDVAELLALKGAEIILFPSAGYYRGLMPARAADNGVRVAASSLAHPCGIWDTTGTEVSAGGPEETCFPNHPPAFREVIRRRLGRCRMLLATLDLSQSPSPHNWGGPVLSAPGGRRNRRQQRRDLTTEIHRRLERWWD